MLGGNARSDRTARGTPPEAVGQPDTVEAPAAGTPRKAPSLSDLWKAWGLTTRRRSELQHPELDQEHRNTIVSGVYHHGCEVIAEADVDVEPAAIRKFSLEAAAPRTGVRAGGERLNRRML